MQMKKINGKFHSSCLELRVDPNSLSSKEVQCLIELLNCVVNIIFTGIRGRNSKALKDMSIETIIFDLKDDN